MVTDRLTVLLSYWPTVQPVAKLTLHADHLRYTRPTLLITLPHNPSAFISLNIV